MMPETSVYGVWPRSGEIDIMEARGNAYDYPAGGRDLYYGSLHWGELFIQTIMSTAASKLHILTIYYRPLIHNRRLLAYDSRQATEARRLL